LLALKVQVILIGVISDNSWVHVTVNLSDLPNLKDAPIAKNNSSGTIDGWIRAIDIKIIANSLKDLPIELAPPTPTPLPNKAPGDKGITYKYTDDYGVTRSYVLPCGSDIPPGATCVCNCVTYCSCNGYVAPRPTACPCVSNSTITQPCGAPIPPGYVCTCNCMP